MRFSSQIRETISQGQAEAIRLGNNFIGTEHLLLGLIHDNSKVAGLLRRLNVDLGKLRDEAEQLVQGKRLRKNQSLSNSHSLPLSEQAEKVILETVREAKARKSTTVEPNDLMVSIVKNFSSIDSLLPARQAIAR